MAQVIAKNIRKNFTLKYKIMRIWNLKEYYPIWIYHAIRRFYYRIFHGIYCSGVGGSLLPELGKGKYISVYRKHNFIDIKNERNDGDLVRVVPYQPNHGFMVEFWRDGKLCGRSHLDYQMLKAFVIGKEEDPLLMKAMRTVIEDGESEI